MSFDLAASDVLRRYPCHGAGAAPVALGSCGGFSGARFWSAAGLCLRAWPPPGPAPERLRWIHDLMAWARRAGLAYVPAVERTADGQTWVQHEGRLWEVTTWMPGRADFHARPTAARLQAACQAVAQVHQAWAASASVGPCTALAQRLSCARDWLALVGSGWRPDFAAGAADPVTAWARRAWVILPVHVPPMLTPLAYWAGRPLRLQACLCDVWHAHVLFEGEVVSGLVDYGGVKSSHVAADLARLLGSLVGDHGQMRQIGLAAYRELCPLSSEEEALVTLLDRSGTVLGAVNWLRWLYEERRSFDDRGAVARRLAEIVARMEGWSV
jgi:homoserine kinase type II